jgi:hypothetical protein
MRTRIHTKGLANLEGDLEAVAERSIQGTIATPAVTVQQTLPRAQLQRFPTLLGLLGIVASKELL